MLNFKKMLRTSVIAFVLALATLVALVGVDGAEVVGGLSPRVTGGLASLLILVMAIATAGAIYAATDLLAHRRAARKAAANRKGL